MPLTAGTSSPVAARPTKADELQALARANPSVVIEKLDVTDHAGIEALGAKLAGQPLDILLNNAGIIGPVPIRENVHRQHFGSMEYDVWQEVIETNTFGPLKMAETFLEHLKAGEQKKLVNISSNVSSIAEMTIPAIAYASSKSALNRAMTIVAEQLKQDGIIVALFCPGYVKTRMDSHGYAMVEIEESHQRTAPADCRPDDGTHGDSAELRRPHDRLVSAQAVLVQADQASPFRLRFSVFARVCHSRIPAQISSAVSAYQNRLRSSSSMTPSVDEKIRIEDALARIVRPPARSGTGSRNWSARASALRTIHRACRILRETRRAPLPAAENATCESQNSAHRNTAPG